MLFNIFILLFIIFSMFYIRKCIKSRYKIENNKLIFYPNNLKSGYVATVDQVDQVKKTLKKLLFFNFIGYKKSIENIFKTSEKYNYPLDKKIYLENLARATNWYEIFFLLLICTCLIIIKISNIFYISIIIICIIIFINNIVLVKMKQTKNKNQ